MTKQGITIIRAKKLLSRIREKIWLYTFSDPYTTAARVSESLKMSPNTARKGLRTLAEAGLLYMDESTRRNVKYRNYDLIRILN